MAEPQSELESFPPPDPTELTGPVAGADDDSPWEREDLEWDRRWARPCPSRWRRPARPRPARLVKN